MKSYPLHRSAYVTIGRRVCACVDTTKSLGADTILIYLVSFFFFLFPFVSFLFFLILDCAADRRGIFCVPGSRFRSIASLVLLQEFHSPRLLMSAPQFSMYCHCFCVKPSAARLSSIPWAFGTN